MDERNKDKDKAVDSGEVSFWCSSRFGLAVIGFLGFINLFALRVNISVALVCMVNHTSSLDVNVTAGQLNATEVTQCRFTSSSKDDKAGEFNWDKVTQGLILGSFYWGYIVTQLPGGLLASRFGGKRVFGWCMFGCALANLLTPVGARTHVVFLMVLRVIGGLGQGVVWPAMHTLWASWAPPLERSKLAGFTYAGSQVGNILTFPLAGLLCEYGFDGGWASIFYITGATCVVWFLAWMLLAFDTPAEHPRISVEERDYIENSLKGQMEVDTMKKMSIPWFAFFKSPPVWAIVVAHTCCNWGTYTFLSNTPTYMREVLKFNIKANGVFSSLPFVGFAILINATGFLADFLRSRALVSTTMCRKIFNSLGMLVPAALVLVLGYIDCSTPYTAVALLTIGVAFTGCTVGSGFVVNHVDIAPKYAGILFGISNTAATIPGFLAPYVIGVLTNENQSEGQWRIVFYIAAGIYTFGALFYIIIGSGDIQSWAMEEITTPHNDGEEDHLWTQEPIHNKTDSSQL
ncbi:sialin-like [Lineus longissimus]|uniref:sialin-like n=1 Tax=Lineus longissimus TaxID=88925 RepID=UPI00315CAF72